MSRLSFLLGATSIFADPSFELPFFGSSRNFQILKNPIHRSELGFLCVPGKIRTPDLLVRSQALYPAEPRAQLLPGESRPIIRVQSSSDC